jgi:hypothetical protein
MPSHHSFILEVQKYLDPLEDENKDNNGCFVHVGYMSRYFKTKNAAVKYYDTNNKHMRSLNAHGTLASDWDPVTELRYCVRINNGEQLSISPFTGSGVVEIDGIITNPINKKAKRDKQKEEKKKTVDDHKDDKQVVPPSSHVYGPLTESDATILTETLGNGQHIIAFLPFYMRLYSPIFIKASCTCSNRSKCVHHGGYKAPFIGVSEASS